jgi:hypothetical protein
MDAQSRRLCLPSSRRSESNTDAHGYSYGYGNSNRYSHSNSYSYADTCWQGYSDAKASPDAKAPSVALSY